MSLDAILEAIRASGEKQVGEIEARACAQAAEILAEAHTKAQKIQEDTCAAAAAPAVREQARIIHQAHLQALQITGSRREALVDEALEHVRGCLVDIRADTRYSSILHKLAKEALAELSGALRQGTAVEGMDKARLAADPRDRLLLERILADLGLNLPVSYELDCWGGVIAKSEDERIVVINLFEARLERATPFLRRYLAALFEDEHLATELDQV